MAMLIAPDASVRLELPTRSPMIEKTKGTPPPMAIPVKARVQYSCCGGGGRAREGGQTGRECECVTVKQRTENIIP